MACDPSNTIATEWAKKIECPDGKLTCPSPDIFRCDCSDDFTCLYTSGKSTCDKCNSVAPTSAPIEENPNDMTCEQWGIFVGCDTEPRCDGNIRFCNCSNGDTINYDGNIYLGSRSCGEGTVAPIPPQSEDSDEYSYNYKYIGLWTVIGILGITGIIIIILTIIKK